jgi:putative DNA methylase
MKMAISKQRRYASWRNLPHLQHTSAPLLISISTKKRWQLPPSARDIVFESILREHATSAHIFAFVVMPDHVHILLRPAWANREQRYTIAEIMSGIKGPSAHRINKLLGRRGAVWEEEYFDHVLRKSEDLDAKVAYICENPQRAGIVKSYLDYRWLWVNQD